jgi:hypothetical protein
VVAGISTGLAIWSNGKLNTAQDQLAVVQKDTGPSGDCAPSKLNDISSKTCAQRMTDAQGKVDQYRTARLWGYIGIGAGAALVATGIVLLLTEPNPDKGDAEKTLVGSLQPVLSAGPEGASLWLSGRF